MTTHPIPRFFWKNTKKVTLAIFIVTLSATILDQAHAVTYKVYADDEDTSSISSSELGFYDLGEAMALAKAGDTVSLGDGTYRRALVTKADGDEGNPITIVGGENAVINGDYSSRSVLVQHSHITLKVRRERERKIHYSTGTGKKTVAQQAAHQSTTTAVY